MNQSYFIYYFPDMFIIVDNDRLQSFLSTPMNPLGRMFVQSGLRRTVYVDIGLPSRCSVTLSYRF